MEIKKICVLGAGLMGSGIAQVSAEAGFDVSMRDIEDRFVQGGLNIIKKNYERAIGKGKMKKEDADRFLSKVKGTVAEDSERWASAGPGTGRAKFPGGGGASKRACVRVHSKSGLSVSETRAWKGVRRPSKIVQSS